MKKLYTATKTVHYEEYYLLEVEIGEGDDPDEVERELTESLQMDELEPYYTRPCADDESVDLAGATTEGAAEIEAHHAGAREPWTRPHPGD